MSLSLQELHSRIFSSLGATYALVEFACRDDSALIPPVCVEDLARSEIDHALGEDEAAGLFRALREQRGREIRKKAGRLLDSFHQAYAGLLLPMQNDELCRELVRAMPQTVRVAGITSPCPAGWVAEWAAAVCQAIQRAAGLKRICFTKGRLNRKDLQAMLDGWNTARSQLSALALPDPEVIRCAVEQNCAAAARKLGVTLHGKRRRRQAAKGVKRLTAKQLEAMHIVGEHKGNYTEAGKAVGISRQAMRKRYEAANKKLGRIIGKNPRTQRLPSDGRGQSSVAAPEPGD